MISLSDSYVAKLGFELETPGSEVSRATSVAQSDVRPSGDIFYSHSLPSTTSRRVVVSFWQKNVNKYWFTS